MLDIWQNWRLSPMGLCEEPIIGAIIRTPANTWSNLGYIFMGLFLFWAFRKQLKKFPLLKIIPAASIIVGLCSFAYHASYTWVLLLLDNASMFLLSSFIVSINLARIVESWQKSFWARYWFFVIWLTVLMLVFRGGASGSILFLLSYLFPIGFEVVIKKLKNDIPTYKYFALMLGFQIVAAIFWLLDQRGILCDSQNHIFQGHVVWHVFNAISIFFMYKHYELYFRTKKHAK